MLNFFISPKFGSNFVEASYNKNQAWMIQSIMSVCMTQSESQKWKKANGKLRLAERLENEKLLKKVVEFVTFGLGLVATTVLDAANLLLQRDYPSIVNFGNEKSNSFGTIMVPQIALPGVPKIFDVDQTRDAIEKLNEAGDKKSCQ